MNRGIVLIQIMIIAVVLSLVALLLIHWGLGRHMLVTRSQQSTQGSYLAQGALAAAQAQWQADGVCTGGTNCFVPGSGTPTTAPPCECKYTIDGRQITVSVSGTSPGPYNLSVNVPSP